MGDTPELFLDPDTRFDPSAAGGAAPALGAGGAESADGALPGSPAGSPGGVLPGSLPVEPGAAAGAPGAIPGAAPVAAEPAGPGVEADPTGGARRCAAPAAPLLLDFEVANNGPTQALFGDFQNVLSGGTYFYPEGGGAGLVSNVATGSWSISGTVTEPAGFGLFFDCQALDASAFVGIAFRVSGSFGSGGVAPERLVTDAGVVLEGGSPGEIELVVGSAANDVARSWFVQRGASPPGASFGRCFPVGEQFDGSCRATRLRIPVSAEPRDVVVRFAELGAGSPEPGLNPAELTTIAWELPRVGVADAGTEPYSFDLVLDDIRFVAP